MGCTKEFITATKGRLERVVAGPVAGVVKATVLFLPVFNILDKGGELLLGRIARGEGVVHYVFDLAPCGRVLEVAWVKVPFWGGW